MGTDSTFADWIGRTQTLTDRVTAVPVKTLFATLDDAVVAPRDGDPLPPLWHWLFFLPDAPMSQVGPDGHPKRGGFLPPVPLERRMWAGGRLRFVGDPPRVGDDITRVTEIRDVTEKAGKAGSMVFVTLHHTIATPRGPAVEEEQDIVYIAMPDRFVPPPGQAAPSDPAWSDPLDVDPVLLFRYSALTFNGHRIHYDRPYAMEVEKYPGLVVHGPLQAMVLLGSARRHAPSGEVAAYSFRGVHPLFDFDTVSMQGVVRDDGGHDLATVNGDGHVCMKATVQWTAT
ncbi:FAS1-like dehydratase domain-containing protein [Roseospira visakhapatnamensis]|uniref:3-methylfumaryl-CoA hydratase n=1 Tax=Roseospira visakhapatnamensis TaxID=390880 RepID=A0A7W6WA83_9PROT|nr:MaoC family dehydratase N-terminal domain-containing protein [Roseospira visakhapatnamensis]MBB4266211.1 3-methylfumaryl-CoA hydratase [Roseospira visakhapatnamensis]